MQLCFIDGAKEDADESIDLQLDMLLTSKVLNYSLVDDNMFNCLTTSVFDGNNNFIYGDSAAPYVLNSMNAGYFRLAEMAKSQHSFCLWNLQELILEGLKAEGEDPFFKGLSHELIEKFSRFSRFQWEQLLSQIACENLEKSLLKKKKGLLGSIMGFFD